MYEFETFKTIYSIGSATDQSVASFYPKPGESVGAIARVKRESGCSSGLFEAVEGTKPAPSAAGGSGVGGASAKGRSGEETTRFWVSGAISAEATLGVGTFGLGAVDGDGLEFLECVGESWVYGGSRSSG